MLPIYALTPFTLLDFPGRTACIVWFAGCNMRCLYCHNPQIVRGGAQVTEAEVLGFLARRRGLLDGVVLSGGEATLYPALLELVRQIKAMGFAVKLDTNGSRPAVVAELLAEGLLDYVALDFKSPRALHQQITAHTDAQSVRQTLQLALGQSACGFEVRTTVHTDLLDEAGVNALLAELAELGFAGTLYLQNYRGDENRSSLGKLAPQRRELDLDRLTPPVGISLAFRNFAPILQAAF